MALEPVEGLRILSHYGNPRVITLLNTRPIQPMDVISGNATYPEVLKVIGKIKELSKRVWTLNATEVAMELGDPDLLKYRHAGSPLCHGSIAHQPARLRNGHQRPAAFSNGG
jgi:hypothetical protein